MVNYAIATSAQSGTPQKVQSSPTACLFQEAKLMMTLTAPRAFSLKSRWDLNLVTFMIGPSAPHLTTMYPPLSLTHTLKHTHVRAHTPLHCGNVIISSQFFCLTKIVLLLPLILLKVPLLSFSFINHLQNCSLHFPVILLFAKDLQRSPQRRKC